MGVKTEGMPERRNTDDHEFATVGLNARRNHRPVEPARKAVSVPRHVGHSVQLANVRAPLPPHCCQHPEAKGSYKDLTADCQQRFREINLHWHDL